MKPPLAQRHALGVLVTFLALPLLADEPDLEALLGRSIIGPHLSMSEVQAYTEARVPHMPVVTAAADWERQAGKIRRDMLERVIFRGEAKRWREADARVEWLASIEGGPGYRIKKLRYEAVPGLWMPALLYEPEKIEGKVPVVLNVNGHDADGKAARYKQARCINLAKRGMLALNTEWLGMGQLQGDSFSHYRSNQLDLCGTSGLAVFYLAMIRALDLLLALEHADCQRVAVTGLSGGGWQTIFISSLDTRVTLAAPVAGYTDFRTRVRHLSDLGDSEQTPVDMATVADYTHLTALRAPRPTLLVYNEKDDCCFRSAHALPPLLEATQPFFQLYGKPENLRQHVNSDPGTHNYEQDNRQAFYRMLGDHFYCGKDFDAADIPCDGELKSKEQLHVELPTPNGDFHTLAIALSGKLPRCGELPSDRAQAQQWQHEKRAALGERVRAARYDVQAEKAGSAQQAGLEVTFWRLRLGGAWTVPAVEFVPCQPSETVILVADDGRQNCAAQVKRFLAAGKRVIAIDPFYFGESKIEERDFLFALLIAAVGERPLGIQASQMAAIARWARAQQGDRSVTLVACGPRSSLFSLVAAALEPEAIAAVELHGSLGSLKEIIEQNGSADKTPELFCFGLLDAFDIKQLAALVTPREVRFEGASDRARHELAELKPWYAVWDAPFDPLP